MFDLAEFIGGVVPLLNDLHKRRGAKIHQDSNADSGSLILTNKMDAVRRIHVGDTKDKQLLTLEEQTLKSCRGKQDDQDGE